MNILKKHLKFVLDTNIYVVIIKGEIQGLLMSLKGFN